MILSDSSKDGEWLDLLPSALFSLAYECTTQLINMLLLIIMAISISNFLDWSGEAFLKWVGYLGCMGEMQSFAFSAILAGIFFPVLTFGLLVMCCQMYTMGWAIFDFAIVWQNREWMRKRGRPPSSSTELQDAATCGGAIMQCMGCVVLFVSCMLSVIIIMLLLVPSLGFFIPVISGIIALIPMIGVLIFSVILTCMLKIVLMIAEIILLRANKGKGVPLEELGMKMGSGILLTFILCIPRSAMIWGMPFKKGRHDIGKAYAFAFKTLGSMPVSEEWAGHQPDLRWRRGCCI